MTAGSGSIGVESLLAHQGFVLALARSLLRDEDAAADVAQETWLAALRRPPRSIASVRAWLAQVTRSRAGDRLRRDLRRAEHERLAARAEADDAGAGLRDRLALQHRVVEAVLALREPYRATILRHHYEGLTAAEIARSEGVPAGTVRARISRAHAALRERLDADFGGGRRLWAGALLAWVDRVGGPPAGLRTWIAGAGIAAAAAVPLVAWVATAHDETPVLAASPLEATLAPPPRAEPVLDAPSSSEARAPAVAAALPPASTANGSPETESASQGPAKGKKDKAAEGLPANPGFEAKPGPDGSIPGWNLIVGATNGALTPLSVVKVDAKEKRAGRASLSLSGDDTTRAWRAAQQTFEVRPGGTYSLSAWAKVEDVRQETIQGTQIRQFPNCFVGLFFYDDNGELLANDVRTPALPTSSWQELEIELKAPEAARSGMISVSLTMSGSLWIDEVSLAVEGGNHLPPKEVLVDEDFENVTGLPGGWEEVVGATNGTGPKRSKVAVDRGSGAGGSKASLRFSGEKSTIQWLSLERKFDAVPGDTFSMRANVRAENVRKEGVQFTNLHARLVFLDGDGKTLGSPRFVQPGDGTYDWKEVSVAGVAPEGTTKVLAGLFLSMSGDAWFDDLVIEKRTGGTPAYGGWLTLETEHLILRYPEDHPRAKTMKTYGEKLDRAFEEVVRQLGVEYTDKITAFLYRDEFQGKKLTGRELDFANPEGKAFHQRPNSTLSHEMTHCIALKMGNAQTGLLGEGIAVWLNGDTPESHHERAAKMLEKGELPSMQDLIEKFRDQANGYPAAGSFCGYLIETYGIEKFKQLYPTTDPAAASNAVLGKGFDAVDEEWREFLKSR